MSAERFCEDSASTDEDNWFWHYGVISKACETAMLEGTADLKIWTRRWMMFLETRGGRVWGEVAKADRALPSLSGRPSNALPIRDLLYAGSSLTYP